MLQSLGRIFRLRRSFAHDLTELVTGSELKSELAKLGIHDAFTREIADFTGMVPRNSFYISAVVHKAFVHVDETGTEAAAATGVKFENVSATIQGRPLTFRADHPFLVVLRHRATGSILFLGRVFEPRAT